jgi:hypothetical protein
MKNIINLLFVFIILPLSNLVQGQPYLYYEHRYWGNEISDSFTRDTVFQLNLCTNEIRQFMVTNEIGSPPNVDQTSTFLAINEYKSSTYVFNISDTSKYFVSPEFGDCEKLLYSQKDNRMYLFSFDWAHLQTLTNYDMTRQKEESIISLPPQESCLRNYRNREAFLSQDQSTIYFQMPDTTTEYLEESKAILACYSCATNSVYRKQHLSELLHPGASEYYLYSGAAGVGVVISIMDSLQADCYYSVYDFDNSRQLGEVHCSGNPDPYVIGSNKYLALFDPANDTTEHYHYSGSVSIYDIMSGHFVKNITLPSDGEVIRYDTYPDTLYYVKNLNGTPEIYKIKANDIAQSKYISMLIPAITFSNTGGFTLEVTGKGFTAASKVLWNDSVRTTTFVSDSLLRASILAADVATVGNKIVRVKYDSTSSAVSDSMVFSVVTTLPKPIRLVIEKEIDNHNGTMTAWFGYLNVNDRSVYIPVGDKNSFSPTPIDRGQATIFLPGRHKYVFGVTFPNTINIEWQLNGRRAKAGSVCEN